MSRPSRPSSRTSARAIARRLAHYIVSAMGVVCAPLLPIAAQEASPFTGIESRTLANGLKVWVRPFDGDPTVDVLLVVAGGSSLENEGEEELAHFAEHAVFGDRPGLSEQALNAQIESLGGRISAGTSADRTIFRVTLPAAHASTAIRWMAQLVTPREVTPELIRQQLPPILLELGAGPRGVTERLRALYLDPPYLRRATPWRRDFGLATYADGDYDPSRSLRRLGTAALRGFMDRAYAPANMTLVVAGGVAPAAALTTIDSTFASLPARPAATLPRAALREGQRPLTIWSLRRQATYAHVLRGASLSAEERVLVLFLRDFLDKRLNDRLRYGASKLVYHPTVALALRLDAAILSVVAASDGASVDRVRAIVDEEIARLRRGDAADSAFVADRRAVAERFRLSVRGREAIIDAAGSHFFATGAGGTMPDMVALQEGVTPARLAALLRDRFPEASASARLVRPAPAPVTLLAVAAAALAWVALALARRRLVVPVDMRRLRYAARLRLDRSLALALLLAVAIPVAIVARVLVAGVRPVLEAAIFPLPGALQLGAYAMALVLGVWALVLVGSRIPRKLLVFEDHARLKFLTYRSAIIRPEDIAECRLAGFRDAWLRGDWRRRIALTFGVGGDALLVRVRDGRSLFVRSRATAELRDALRDLQLRAAAPSGDGPPRAARRAPGG